MRMYNYMKPIGGFIDSTQRIEIEAEPSDRQGKKLLEEAMSKINASTERFVAQFKSKNPSASEEEIKAEQEKFSGEAVQTSARGGYISVPLQYVQDYLIRKIAGLQNNVSIHDKDDVKELADVLGEYNINVINKFDDLTFDSIRWTEKAGQKPKVLLYAKDSTGDSSCIRFEAAGELAQKILFAVQQTKVLPGSPLDLEFSAEDPAVRRNSERSRLTAKGNSATEEETKKLKSMGNPEKEGVFVNHNLTLTTKDEKGAPVVSNGRPPKGQAFVQKMSMEDMKSLFDSVNRSIPKDAKYVAPPAQAQETASPVSSGQSTLVPPIEAIARAEADSVQHAAGSFDTSGEDIKF